MKLAKGIAAIVTGGGSGMGAATAKALAAAGAKVALLDVREENAQAVAKEIGGLAIGCDVTNPESVSTALKKANAAHGSARILVHCAGILTGARILSKEGPADLEQFARTVNVNLVGTFNMLRLAAAEMAVLEPVTKSGERGVIINTASIAAFEGQIGQAAYAASKGGVVALTLPVARELARSGIRVMAIAPGAAATPMIGGLPEDIQASIASSIPFPSRFVAPEEFAALALHIIENEMLNGTVIRLDGATRLAPK
jgi:NAD(P)-dependent dehydrogenase (short-subunit alcohol dehydrogenase family)